MICASIFGTGMVWDAFAVAFKIPNLFRRLFGEGALSAAFIPIFTEYIEKRGKAEAMAFVNVIATVLIIILGGIVLLGEGSFFAIPRMFHVQEKWQLVFKLSIIMFPYVFFICLVAFMGAVLNTLHHFFMPAFAPVVMNVCWILGAVLAPYTGKTLEKMIYAVAISTFLSGLVQLIIHFPVLRRKELYYRPVSRFSDPGLKLVLTRMGPVVFGLAVVQINVLVDSIIAVGFSAPQGGSGYFHFAGMAIHYPMKAGAASVLYYSDRLIQFPLGVFGIAMATAVFPLFSTHAVREDWNNFSTTFNRALKFMLLIGIPASLAIIMLREPIIDLIYRRKQFDAESAHRTSSVILFYAIGIWAYCGLHVLIRAFYSVKDTITPVRIGAICVGLDFVLNLSLIWILQEGGLALSTAISAIVQIIILTIILQKRLRIKIGREVVVSTLKTVTASVAMVIACWFVLKMFPASDGSGSLYFKGLRLFAPMTAAFAAFAGTSILLKSEEFGNLVRLSLRKS
ncbi:MAG: murein biosynthesis integral membrane protein MurJ [Planctomycetes bacterium GWB2_41_19]|nr:MAG: murein biosynthesis integral membrane protein MurJ [Planctomycetes bacterium GWB2_41_19]